MNVAVNQRSSSSIIRYLPSINSSLDLVFAELPRALLLVNRYTRVNRLVINPTTARRINPLKKAVAEDITSSIGINIRISDQYLIPILAPFSEWDIFHKPNQDATLYLLSAILQILV